MDAANEVTISRGYCNGGLPLCVGDGVYFDNISGGNINFDFDAVALPTGTGDVWLRLRHVDGMFTGSYSLDGGNWSELASRARTMLDPHLRCVHRPGGSPTPSPPPTSTTSQSARSNGLVLEQPIDRCRRSAAAGLAANFVPVATVDELLGEIRAICLGFPEAVEQETWEQPTFRVRSKIFAIVGEVDPADEDRASMVDRGGSPALIRISMKTPPGDQELLLAEGEPFFFPPYVGSRGWIGIVVGETTDFSEIAELIEDSYRMTAPKRLLAELDP